MLHIYDTFGIKWTARPDLDGASCDTFEDCMRGPDVHVTGHGPGPANDQFLLLLFSRSCLIVGHHRLTDEFFPATAVFGSPYAL